MQRIRERYKSVKDRFYNITKVDEIHKGVDKRINTIIREYIKTQSRTIKHPKKEVKVDMIGPNFKEVISAFVKKNL